MIFLRLSLSTVILDRPCFKSVSFLEFLKGVAVLVDEVAATLVPTEPRQGAGGVQADHSLIVRSWRAR